MQTVEIRRSHQIAAKNLQDSFEMEHIEQMLVPVSLRYVGEQYVSPLNVLYPQKLKTTVE